MADHQQAAAEALDAQLVVGAQEVHQPLAVVEAPHEEDVGNAVVPAREGRHVPELLQVDAVGDDLVLAGEIARDEMARCRAHGDTAMQATGGCTHEAFAELVGGAEARVGVERGDVHGLGVAQDHQRQEGHEGLMEVDHVEAFAIEHLGDQPGIAMRDGERADRAVGGHAPAVAEADDVALAGALRSVCRADDADIVAALDEVLVEVSDVGVDATRKREDVRRDQPDLHVVVSSAGRPADSRSKRTGRSRPPG